MGARVKTFPQIIREMLATIRGASATAKSVLTDANAGAVIRSMLEAAALQDADQYAQIGKLRDIFSIDKAEGDDLDRRALDYGVTRLRPTTSYGLKALKISDDVHDGLPSTKIESTLNGAVSIGDQAVLLTTAAFFDAAVPASGVVIFDRDYPDLREQVAFTRGNVNTNQLLLSTALTKNHANGASAVLSRLGADMPVSTGTMVQVPANGVTDQLFFELTEDVVLYDGDVSVLASARSLGVGTVQNIAAGRVEAFAARPWPTALATNVGALTGGTDLESDTRLRDRIRTTIQSASGTTVAALKRAALAVTDPSTGNRVTSAQVIEPVQAGGATYLYVDNGSGTISETADFLTAYTCDTSNTSVVGLEIIRPVAAASERRFKLNRYPIVPNTLRLFKSVARGTASAYDAVTRTLTVSGTYGLNVYAGMLLFANGHLYSIASNTGQSIVINTLRAGGIAPLGSGPYAILDLAAAPLVVNTDYTLNEANGQLELAAGLAANDCLVAAGASPSTAAYAYYTGLIALVQKVINGEQADIDSYPGVKATGVKVVVVAPTVDYISFVLDLTAEVNTKEEELYPDIRSAVETYMNSLGTGDDVIVSSVVAAVKSIPGVYDVRVVLPSTNVVTLDGHLARTTNDRITIV